MPTDLVSPLAGARIYWDYEPSNPRPSIVWRRWRARSALRGAPQWKTLRHPTASGRWLMYFMFLPLGQMTAQHRFTLQRLAQENASLMIVCACPPDHAVLQDLNHHCDALYWKGMEGFDFSAYAIALSELARHAPGSDVMLLNDSMLGPFSSLTPFIDASPWRLAGLSASALEENHLQSFALIARQVDDGFLQAVKSVLSTEWCFSASSPVILLQETLLARVAAPHMSVGAYWYTDGSQHIDLCLNCPEQLVDAGFPLVKRSLFGKFAGHFQDIATMQRMLHRLGHPPVMGFAPRSD